MLAVQNRRPEFGSPVPEERPGVAVHVNQYWGIRDRRIVRAYCPASLTKFMRGLISVRNCLKKEEREKIFEGDS